MVTRQRGSNRHSSQVWVRKGNNNNNDNNKDDTSNWVAEAGDWRLEVGGYPMVL